MVQFSIVFVSPFPRFDSNNGQQNVSYSTFHFFLFIEPLYKINMNIIEIDLFSECLTTIFIYV